MKKENKPFLISSLAVLVVILIYTTTEYFSYQKEQQQNALRALVKPIIITCVDKNWDADTFMSYASPDLKKWIQMNGTDVLTFYRGLGIIKEYHGIKDFKEKGNQMVVRSLVSFQTSTVFVDIKFSRHDGAWLIDNIHISPADEETEAG